MNLRKYLLLNISLGTLKRLLPGAYLYLVRLKAKGYQIWKSLENGVCKYPALEGRFPMVYYLYLS